MAGSHVLRRGTCPGVVDAMAAADGMLMRIRLPGGAIDARQLAAVGRVARRFGSGVIEITTRANLQIRGVDAECLTAAAEVLIDEGLSDGEAGADARRAIVAPALAGHDPQAGVDLTPYVAAIAERLAGARLVGALPAKCSVVVDDATTLGVGDVAGDVVVEVGAGDPVEGVSEAVLGEIATISAGGRPPARPRHRSPGFTGPIVGVHPHLSAAHCNLIAAPPLGRLGVQQIETIVDVSAGAGVRFTHRRGVALVGVDRAHLDDLVASLGRCSLSIDAADPVHGVSACAGSPGCASSRGDTNTAANALVGDRRDRGGVHDLVHFSGCEKLCGAPTAARLLVADTVGRFEEVE